MIFSQRHFTTLKTFLRAILFVKKVLGVRREQNSFLPTQSNKNASKHFEWKRITLEDIDRLWQKSGKLDAPFREQLNHFAQGVESILKSDMPAQHRLNWQSITQDEIDRQWVVSFSVHPASGQQLGHFAVGIERLVVSKSNCLLKLG
jgi:hypothetical protein